MEMSPFQQSEGCVSPSPTIYVHGQTTILLEAVPDGGNHKADLLESKLASIY